MSTFRLKDEVICVTGASSGIGAAIAAALYKEGANIAIGARRKAKLEEVADSIKQGATEGCPGQVITIECDVTNRDSVQQFVDQACAAYHVDCLTSMIAVAGVMYFTEMKNCFMDQWDRTIDVNCKGVTNCLGAILPKMVAAKAGKIVTITSDAGVRQFPNLAMYCASKHFVETLCEITRRELVGTGVTLHTIQPGDVKGTELIMDNSDKSAAEKMGVEIGKPVGEGFDRTQLLDPQDVANAVVFVLTAPSHVAVNSMLIEPKNQE